MAILGLATSVGGVPFSDVDTAVDFALRAHERFPTVPVVHRCDRSLLALSLLGVTGTGPFIGLDPDTFDPATFDPASAGDLEALLVAAPDALEPLDRVVTGAGVDVPAVRLGVLGPVTLALALGAVGVNLDTAVHSAAEIVAARASALLRRIHAERPGLGVVIVLHEAGLVGSLHPTFPLGRSTVADRLLGPTIEGLADASPGPGLVGVHVPGRTDWDAVVSAGPAFLSLPADPDVVSWAPAIERFVDAGGVCAWGAVPVNRPLGLQADSLWRSLSATFASLAAEGLDPAALRFHSLVEPVDGLSEFDATGAGRVIDLCTELSSRLRRQSLATRLSLGA
ncbi:MAG: hypothetical protein FJW94_00225 [Actinobacteria bacterium]|nr:hypothetical protein [Actinomycetota bacterium]